MFTAFMVAITLTTVANVLITLALGPLLTALVSRIFLAHRLHLRTWGAIVVAGLGIAWIFASQVQLAGDGHASPVAGMLVALRALADAAIAYLTGLLKQRDLPPGLRAFLAKRGRQTEESIEAEFDALKEKGREVEALLERPIAEVRARANAP